MFTLPQLWHGRINSWVEGTVYLKQRGTRIPKQHSFMNSYGVSKFMIQDSRVSSWEDALGRRRFRCCLGGRLLPSPEEVGRPCVRGRCPSQFGMSIGSVSKKVNKAGSASGLRRVKLLWSFLNVTDSGYPQRYVAPFRLARSSSGFRIARLCRVARDKSGKILIVAPSSSGSSASQALRKICSLCT